jgi:hypothetical protein
MDRTHALVVDPLAPHAGALPSAALASASAVSWGAILAGAAGAAALSLILLILGTGLGLSSVSPWSGQGAGATAFGVSTILWVTFTQLAASGMGGYLAGRLRTRWAGAQADEVYFRDTAHGFLAWAVASLATAALLTSAIAGIVGGGVQAGAGLASTATLAATSASAGPARAALSNEANLYFVDSLFRRDPNASASAATAAMPVLTAEGSAAAQAEVARIFASGVQAGALPPDDGRYAGQVVSLRTGLSQADAEKRVTDTFVRLQARLKDTETAARDATDKARKASAHAALWLFISLLAGAFVASLAATFGGRQRDL